MAKKDIRASLEQQLRDLGADVAHFTDLMDDYMFTCTQERKMQADIRKNGIMIPAVSAAGKEYKRENPACKLAVLYSRHKLEILKQLGLTTENCFKKDDPDGEDL